MKAMRSMLAGLASVLSQRSEELSLAIQNVYESGNGADGEIRGHVGDGNHPSLAATEISPHIAPCRVGREQRERLRVGRTIRAFNRDFLALGKC